MIVDWSVTFLTISDLSHIFLLYLFFFLFLFPFCHLLFYLSIFILFVNEESKIIEWFVAFGAIENHTRAELGQYYNGYAWQFRPRSCKQPRPGIWCKKHVWMLLRLKAHLKKKNPLIHYIRSAAHFLNLLGVKSVEVSCKMPVISLTLYVFCACSTQR